MSAALARPKLSRAQQDALDDLANDLQRAFVFEIVMDPKANGTRAARAAGYKGDDETLAVQASRLLKDAKVEKAIRLLREPPLNRRYRDAEQLKEWWDKGIDNEDWEAKDRIKCSDSLARAQGVYVERRQVEVVNVPTNRAELRARLEQMVAAEGGEVTWLEQLPVGELGEGSGGDE